MAEKTKVAMDIEDEVEEFDVSQDFPEDTMNFLRRNEADILAGLLSAVEYKEDDDNATMVEIRRKGKLCVAFRVRPLEEAEYRAANKKHTKYVKNKTLGVRVPGDTDAVMYRSQLIYGATVKEDRAKIWNNKAAWSKLNLVTGVEMVEKCLLAGEKDAVMELIDSISGYNAVEEVAKN